jgi:hypothetical protein
MCLSNHCKSDDTTYVFAAYLFILVTTYEVIQVLDL